MLRALKCLPPDGYGRLWPAMLQVGEMPTVAP